MGSVRAVHQYLDSGECHQQGELEEGRNSLEQFFLKTKLSIQYLTSNI